MQNIDEESDNESYNELTIDERFEERVEECPMTFCDGEQLVEPFLFVYEFSWLYLVVYSDNIYFHHKYVLCVTEDNHNTSLELALLEITPRYGSNLVET